jgi:hypothetical protein
MAVALRAAGIIDYETTFQPEVAAGDIPAGARR